MLLLRNKFVCVSKDHSKGAGSYLDRNYTWGNQGIPVHPDHDGYQTPTPSLVLLVNRPKVHQPTDQQRYAKDEILQTESVFSSAEHIPNTWPWQPRVWPLYKIRPFVELIKANFNPGQDLSIDEAMIGYKGWIFFKQYMPAKPTKWGIKVWEMCEADSGYCDSFDIYAGCHSWENTTVSLRHELVDKLASPFYDQNRHLYFDWFFSSVPLVTTPATAWDIRVWDSVVKPKGVARWSQEHQTTTEGRLASATKGTLPGHRLQR